MKRKERYDGIINYFSEHHPEAETELNYSNPYELLIAVILSAQCTDKRINQVTPALFEAFPVPEVLAAASFGEVFPYLKSVSYPNNKTKHIIGMAKMLHSEFKGQVPSEVKELQKLPGVGRKTANVVASVIYNQPRMAVDTHVFRVSKRIGLVPLKLKTPLEVENYLVKNIPEEHIARAHHWLILHGRYICLARKPKCPECPVKNFCRYYEKNELQPLV
ncbi:MAG: endonuclease III [Cytophagales bacterium]|nr:endonuclease III [Cytophagales bacterium]